MARHIMIFGVRSNKIVRWLSIALVVIFIYRLISALSNMPEALTVKPPTHQRYDNMDLNKDVKGLYQVKDTKTQKTVDYIADKLHVKYELLSNVREDLHGNFSARMTLSNHGDQTIQHGPWQIYLFHFTLINIHLMDKNKQVQMSEYGLVLTHINGRLNRLETTPKFQPLPPGGHMVINFIAKHSMIARTDFLPNWYVTAPHCAPRVVKCTEGEDLDTLGPFDSPEKWKRSKDDVYNPYQPDHRYELNTVKDLGHAPLNILPTPLSMIRKGNSSLDPHSWCVAPVLGLETPAHFLADALKLGVDSSKSNSQKVISLAIGDIPDLPLHIPDVTEGYHLSVDPTQNRVQIMGASSRSVMYGIQSLLSLIHSNGGHIPHVDIVDAPRYPYRGLMIDVARNFFPLEEIKRMLDAMAMYKLNKLHLHLVDDEGWRIEIPGLEELTQVGGRRCHDLEETRCLLPDIGSGPYTANTGSGYYTQAQYRELIQYARDRGIDVIPEIDMPGHSNAAIKAMRARYLKYKDTDITKAKQYLLHDLNDKSQYMSGQLFKNNVINPCLNSSYMFVEKLISTFVTLHADIAPLASFHLGGDEVPKDALQDSPACETFLKSHPYLKTMKDLKEFFVQRVIAIAAKFKIKIAGWEDAFYSKADELFSRADLGGLGEDSVVAYAWISKWESTRSHRAHEMANKGFQVVLSSATHLYFDHPHEPDPEERGLYWATRFIDMNKVWGFLPEDFFGNIDYDRLGRPLTRDRACKELIKCIPLKNPENILGLQAQVWGETMRQPAHLHSFLFPRLLAVAERAWHRADWEKNVSTMAGSRTQDWTDFINTVGYRELKRLEQLGVEYFLPLPGVRVDNSRLLLNSAYPGLVIQVSEDGGDTWRDFSQHQKYHGDIMVAARSFNKQRRSRSVKVNIR